MVFRWRDYEIDVGELGRRLRSDWRYMLGVALGTLLFLCACGWLFYPRHIPTATVYLAGPAGLTVTVDRETFSGAGPHALPAGASTAHVEAPGYYPRDLALTLTPNTTATLTATLYPRPVFQQVQADLPGTVVEAAFLTPAGVRFATVLSTTRELGNSQPLAQWWEIAPDGRREHLLELESGPAARRDRDGRIAYLRSEGLFLADGERLLTTTANVAALTWWGDDLLLFRSLPTGIQVDWLATTVPLSDSQYLAVLPALPDARYTLPSPGGQYLVLCLPGRASDSLVVLDRRGRASYLADLPAGPLPWAFLAWEQEAVLVWTAPQAQPGGETTWPIYRLDLAQAKSTLLGSPDKVHGLWLAGPEVYYLNEAAQVTPVDGAPLYTMQEIDPGGEFRLWRQGTRALLWTSPPPLPARPTPRGGAATPGPEPAADRYWLLSWPEGERP